MMVANVLSRRFDMVRAAAFLLLFSSLTLNAQIMVLDRALLQQTICGPIGVQARMLGTSLDRPLEAHQKVGITLNNLGSVPIVLERITVHFGRETSTSGAPYELETRVEVGAKQEAFFAELFSVANHVSYIELNSVRYADGSSWHPSEGAVCKIAPEPLKN
jgi:hypothetical protein